jgi:hypothetical protein
LVDAAQIALANHDTVDAANWLNAADYWQQNITGWTLHHTGLPEPQEQLQQRPPAPFPAPDSPSTNQRNEGMKLLYEFIPRLDFVNAADKVKDLVDGWNITDSAGGAPAPSGAAVACVLK